VLTALPRAHATINGVFYLMPTFPIVPVSGRRARVLATTVLACFIASCNAHAADAPSSIESLLKQGWEIGGYTGSLILFKKAGESYLVQCRAIPAVVTSGLLSSGASTHKSNCDKLQ
jgi:hypothetical protein